MSTLKKTTLNKLLEWCELDKRNITKDDEQFLNDLTLTAVDNVLSYLDNPTPEKLEYLKYYIVSCICASYNIGFSRVEEFKEKINQLKKKIDSDVDGEEWKSKV
jgi:hypothetical protein